MKNYKLLEKEIEQISQINNTINLLYWDMATYMPSGSSESREKEITTLTLIANTLLKSKKISELIENIKEKPENLDKWQFANVKEIERNIKESKFIDDNLQKRYISSTTKCELVWREAKKDNDYSRLKPYLMKVLSCTKEIAEVKASVLGCSKYDALIDMYDPARTTTEIKAVYAVIKKEIPSLIQQIIEKQSIESFIPISNIISSEQQQLICKRIVEALGFDFMNGRIDESAHPACWGTPYDVRLTNRHDDFISGIMGIIHETGHGLYEQNLPHDYKNQPVGKAKGMAIHESQSLFMEMQVGRSKEFIEYLAGILKKDFGLNTHEYSGENLYKLITRVRPSFIRVDADEVTYLMHSILRFEIEEALINDELSLEELPYIWNSKMQAYLNITPKSDREGCLQDIQWTTGQFGYFPAYANGVIIASMLMKKAKILYPKTNQEILSGDFSNLNMFLNEHIRNFGSLKNTSNLIKDATGEEQVNPVIFINYLKEKYLN